MSRRRAVAHAAAALLLWLAVLMTFAFCCYGGRLSFGSVRRRVLHRPAFHLPMATRKMLLALSSFDVSSPPSTETKVATDHHDRHHHHHRHHGHHHHDGGHDRWNRQGVPQSTAGHDEEVDRRFGVQKRLVPTGPNPLHH